ncbi:MAG TPA: hypothetical protein VFB27_15170 [Opitutaceae bacterium]|nr:hypothetical protein [Opitutaceae bacterium]
MKERKDKEIIANSNGVTIFDFPLGFTPTERDLELAFEGETIRNIPPLNNRQLKICDAQGLSWLVDLKLDVVFWLEVSFASSYDKKPTDHDPTEVFKGKVRIGQYTVQGPFLFPIAEVIRKVEIPGLSVMMVPGKKQIHSLTINFKNNETKLR